MPFKSSKSRIATVNDEKMSKYCHLFILLFLFLSKNGISSMPTSSKVCFNDHIRWSTDNGNILLNGEHVFHVKGTTWFGFETETRSPHGLWQHSMDHIVRILKDNQFNTLRIPFSVDLILEQYPKPVTAVDCKYNPQSCTMKPLELLEKLIDLCASYNILVVLDQHRIISSEDTDLWYTQEYPEERILESWDKLLTLYQDKWNILGLDLKNEAHGNASWGYHNYSTDWNKAAERIIKHIGDTHPEYEGLFFVQGVAEEAVSENPNDSQLHWWGGNLEGVWNHPIRLNNTDLDNRVVYSPHVYGPDVYDFDYFRSKAFPDNMQRIWDTHFGFVEGVTGNALVIGEWGGLYNRGTRDRLWHDTFALYLRLHCLSDNFYWALNPNAQETGGLLLDDWESVNSDKLALLDKVQPYPSSLVYEGAGRYCYLPGDFANPDCKTEYMSRYPASDNKKGESDVLYQHNHNATGNPGIDHHIHNNNNKYKNHQNGQKSPGSNEKSIHAEYKENGPVYVENNHNHTGGYHGDGHDDHQNHKVDEGVAISGSVHVNSNGFEYPGDGKIQEIPTSHEDKLIVSTSHHGEVVDAGAGSGHMENNDSYPSHNNSNNRHTEVDKKDSHAAGGHHEQHGGYKKETTHTATGHQTKELYPKKQHGQNDHREEGNRKHEEKSTGYMHSKKEHGTGHNSGNSMTHHGAVGNEHGESVGVDRSAGHHSNTNYDNNNHKVVITGVHEQKPSLFTIIPVLSNKWGDKRHHLFREVQLHITNNSPYPICGGSILKVQPETSVIISRFWNVDQITSHGHNGYRMSPWINIPPGHTNQDIGFIFVSDEMPVFSIEHVDTKKCTY